MQHESRIIVIGASTGGVEALYHILSQVPKNCPPIFVVQHMRLGHVDTFVQGLAQSSAAQVETAKDGTAAKPGHIYLAPSGDLHLTLSQHGGVITRLRHGDPIEGHRPSIDALFFSAARLSTPPVGCLLTGMGRDGAAGLLAIKRAGGPTFAQDRETSVVYGMPKVAAEIGAADSVLPISHISQALIRASTKMTRGLSHGK